VLRFPTLLIPHAISLAFEALVSVKRIEDFLALPDTLGRGGGDGNDRDGVKEEVEQEGRTDEVEGRETMLKLQRASFHYSLEGAVISAAVGVSTDRDRDSVDGRDSDVGRDSAVEAETADLQFCMTGLNLEVQAGELIGIVGRVGSGKTSLLLGLLRELRSTGSVELQVAPDAPIAYAAQSAAIGMFFVCHCTLTPDLLFFVLCLVRFSPISSSPRLSSPVTLRLLL
jgi:ABC-type multidrug transport system fused ATPase/permease subunit